MYIYTYVNIYVCVYLCIIPHTQHQALVPLPRDVHVCVYVRVYVNACVRVYLCVVPHTRVCVCEFVCVCECACVCVRECTCASYPTRNIQLPLPSLVMPLHRCPGVVACFYRVCVL